MRGLLIFLVLVPVLDLALLGHLIGFWNTVFLVLGTAFLGFALIRHQGFSALNAGRQKLAAGQMPLTEMTTGLFLAFAGVLFIHPGFITDALGMLCLVPGVRSFIALKVAAKAAGGQFEARFKTETYQDSHTFEGEFENVQEPSKASIDHQDDKKS